MPVLECPFLFQSILVSVLERPSLLCPVLSRVPSRFLSVLARPVPNFGCPNQSRPLARFLACPVVPKNFTVPSRWKRQFKLALSNQQASSMHLKHGTSLLSIPLPFWTCIYYSVLLPQVRKCEDEFLLVLKIIWLQLVVNFPKIGVKSFKSQLYFFGRLGNFFGFDLHLPSNQQ